MTQNFKDKAYWNMLRVLERIQFWCAQVKSEQAPAPGPDPVATIKRMVTKSGEIITIVRKKM